MVRAQSIHAVRERCARILVAGLTLLLLLATDGSLDAVVRADGGDEVAAIRARQIRAEGSMRRADHQVARLERSLDRHERRDRAIARRLERTIARRDEARIRLAHLRGELALARADRDRRLRVHPDPTGRPRADRPALRRRVHRLQASIERPQRQLVRLARQIERARDVRQARARAGGNARIAARVQARERAESVLGTQIGLMLAIAKDRAAGDELGRLTRPARGRVSQGYGCQAGKPRGGSGTCARFHDGIDIAAPQGTPVRAAAAGTVAYAGWNPWDRGRRAYVVIIGHAEGIETIYAHLKPVRMVRAGERVQRGQRIGVVGLTGHTSGPHVHWEVSRDFQTMDPRHAGR
jgi:murein DD-endopeptidase MepM/ murein hydrolase activator NlpD